jgi:hypothetical protein
MAGREVIPGKIRGRKVLDEPRLNLWEKSGFTGYFHWILIPMWKILSKLIGEDHFHPYHDKEDNCLKEVQLALRLAELKARYADNIVKRHLNLGNIERIYPLILGGQDENGKIHCCWTEFAGFYGKFPKGISTKTTGAVQKILMEKMIKVPSQADTGHTALDRDKIGGKSFSSKVFPVESALSQSESLLDVEGTFSTIDQQQILTDLMRKIPLTDESVWGVQATMDALFKFQGIIATHQIQKIAQHDEEQEIQEKEEWEKILQQEESTSSVLDKENDLKDMKMNFYNKDQQKALRVAIGNMKPRIMCAVDQSYEKPIAYEKQTVVSPSNHRLFSFLSFLGCAVLVCTLFLSVLGIILYFETNYLSSLCSRFAPGFTGIACRQKVCNSCATWRDREGRTCMQYRGRLDLCNRRESGSSFPYYRNDDGIDALQACCECWEGVTDRNLMVREDMCELGDKASSGPKFRVETIQVNSISTGGSYESPVGIALLTQHGDTMTYVLSDSARNLILVLAGNRQTYILAGNSLGSELMPNSYRDGVGSFATFHNPYHLCVSNSMEESSYGGNDKFVYVADSGNHAIRQIAVSLGVSQDGWAGARVSTVAGGGSEGFLDGIGKDAKFSHPSGIAVTPDGKTIIVADTRNNRIRFIDVVSQAVRTVAGTGEHGYRNGVPMISTFAQPVGVSVSGDGSFLAIADSWNHLIRSVSLEVLNGTLEARLVSTLAGVEASPGYQVDLH